MNSNVNAIEKPGNIGTAFDLPTKTESVDLSVNNYMFELIYYEDMDKVLIEFKRALKKGGKLIIGNMTEGKTASSRLHDFICRPSPKTMAGYCGVRLTD